MSVILSPEKIEQILKAINTNEVVISSDKIDKQMIHALINTNPPTRPPFGIEEFDAYQTKRQGRKHPTDSLHKIYPCAGFLAQKAMKNYLRILSGKTVSRAWVMSKSPTPYHADQLFGMSQVRRDFFVSRPYRILRESHP
jgi:hypothetical protein